jgi:hypothetical protein
MATPQSRWNRRFRPEQGGTAGCRASPCHRRHHQLHQHLGPALLIAAGLVARKARKRGLKVPAWVKTSLAPGSPAAASYLERAGLLDDLASVGFDIVGFGCTTCIGNPGP